MAEVNDAGRCDGDCGRAWTLKLSDNGHVYSTAIFAIAVGMNMGRGAKDEHQEADRRNRSYARTVARKSRSGSVTVQHQYTRILKVAGSG
jgi:hypothetical protein